MPGHCGLRCADWVNSSAVPGLDVLTGRGNKDVDGRDEWRRAV
jgi:hypothetical protein